MAWLDGHTADEEGRAPAVLMGTAPANPVVEVGAAKGLSRMPSWPRRRGAPLPGLDAACDLASSLEIEQRPGRCDALQGLLAFSALHQQIRHRRALATRLSGFETVAALHEFENGERFVLDEVLQLVAERAIAITGADGLAIALAENNEIVLRASAGAIKPDVGARIERDSAFSGACFRTAQIIRCDDTETDGRVNLHACRQLGTRSMIAVPLCGRRRVIGLLEAFSAEPFGFNDRDVQSLELLAELIVGALRPEDEDCFAESAQAAEAELAPGEAVTASSAVVQARSQDAAPAIALQVENEPDKRDAEVKAAEPAPALVAAEPAAVAAVAEAERGVRLTELAEDRVSLEVPQESSSSRHPGMVLLLVLVVFAVALAGALWWKMKTAQIGDAMVQPQPVTRPAPTPKAATPPANPPSSVPTSPVPVSSATAALNNPASPALQTEASPGDDVSAASGNYTPQELSKLARVTGIRHWSSADSSTVALDLEDQVQYEAHRLSNPDRIYFDLHDTALAPDLEGKTIDIGDALLARVRVAQPTSGMTRVVLETKGNPNYSVSLEPNPYRLVVQVRKPGTSPQSRVDLFPGQAEPEKMAIVVPPPTREDLQLRTRVPKMRIVVDAGHGGWDLGTVGQRGLLEKDLVLEIAQRLGKLLQSRLGAEVILTRNDDNYIPLDERAGIANQSQADLFISVHANYSDLPSARGVETYYTNFFVSPNAKDMETRPGSSGSRSTVSPAALSPADLHDRIEQSRRLAVSVQRSLYGSLAAQNPGLRDRGVKAASYVVLTETAMPGILAEVSFVSSPTDEQKLRNDGYREQIAEALYKGIAHYAAASRGLKVASAGK